MLLYRDDTGKIFINHPDPVRLIENSTHKVAALVLSGDDLVVSTSFTDHATMIDHAGLKHRRFVIDEAAGHALGDATSSPELASLRGALTTDKVTIHVWNETDVDQEEALSPCLTELYSYLKSHRKLRYFSSFEIFVYDQEYLMTHVFDEAGLREVPSVSPSC